MTMENLTLDQIRSRQRTLLTAILLSIWAPLTTGLAVYWSQSTTQVADFIRRSMELMALMISYFVFRKITGKTPPKKQVYLEKMAGFSVAGAMFSSGCIMFILGITRLKSFTPGGNVYPGLTIAVLGALVNSWFYRRYRKFHEEDPNSVMRAQKRLYRAKTIIDMCVIIALSSVALFPSHPLTLYIDTSGSLVVAFYLLWSGIQALKESLTITCKKTKLLEEKS